MAPLPPPLLDYAYLNRQPCNPGCIKNDAANHLATHAVCNFGALTCQREAQNCAIVKTNIVPVLQTQNLWNLVLNRRMYVQTSAFCAAALDYVFYARSYRESIISEYI